jgi:hypothetical protein
MAVINVIPWQFMVIYLKIYCKFVAKCSILNLYVSKGIMDKAEVRVG